MSRVINAAFEQVAEMNDRKYGQINVQMEGDDQPYIVMISKEPDGNLELAAAYRKDARHEIDWYDNSMHSAYDNVTSDMFVNDTKQMDGMDKDSLLTELLQYQEVREQLDKNLK